MTGPSSYILADRVILNSTTAPGSQMRYLEVQIPVKAPPGVYTLEAAVTTDIGLSNRNFSPI